MVDPRVIMTDNDWHDFMGKYCPGIPYYISVDWSKECLVAELTVGPKANYTTSFSIQKISIINNKIDIQASFDTSTDIYALNLNSQVNCFNRGVTNAKMRHYRRFPKL